jgi:hypothetical protein
MTSVAIAEPVVPYPYDEDVIGRLTDDDWAAMPTLEIDIADLVPTQQWLDIAQLAHGLRNPAPRPVRVVYDGGVCWLHDGHHRYVSKALRGVRSIAAHVVDRDGRPLRRIA